MAILAWASCPPASLIRVVACWCSASESDRGVRAYGGIDRRAAFRTLWETELIRTQPGAGGGARFWDSLLVG